MVGRNLRFFKFLQTGHSFPGQNWYWRVWNVVAIPMTRFSTAEIEFKGVNFTITEKEVHYAPNLTKSCIFLCTSESPHLRRGALDSGRLHVYYCFAAVGVNEFLCSYNTEVFAEFVRTTQILHKFY